MVTIRKRASLSWWEIWRLSIEICELSHLIDKRNGMIFQKTHQIYVMTEIRPTEVTIINLSVGS